MVYSTRRKFKVRTLVKRWRRTIYLLFCACLLPPVLFTQGCNEAGKFKGKRIDASVTKIVLFAIKGPDGEEFTRMLSTELTAMNKIVVGGNDFNQPGSLLEAAKIARDNDAGAFIYGNITNSYIAGLTKYYFNATFTVHETEAGYQIGGIPNFSYTKDTDSLGGLIQNTTSTVVSTIFSKSKKEEVSKKTEHKARMCREIIAERVAEQLCSGKLRGTVKTKNEWDPL